MMIHRLNKLRLVSILFLPILVLIILIGIELTDGIPLANKSSIKKCVFAFISLAFFLPYVLIILNHCPYAKDVVIYFQNKRVRLIYQGNVKEFHYNEIKKITEYSAYSTGNIFRLFMYWCLEVNDEKFIISFLTVSQLNFERMFWSKISEKKEVRWPTIKSLTC